MSWNSSPPQFGGGAPKTVTDVFTAANQYATQAYTQTTGFVDAIRSTIYAPPVLSVTWSSLAPPATTALPPVPTLPNIVFSAPASVPQPLSLDIPNTVLPEFTDVAPVLPDVLPPTLSYGPAPTIPAIQAVTVPVAPVITLPPAPTQMTLSVVALPNINLREDWATRLSDLPQLEILEPTPYTYSRGADYASALLDDVRAQIRHRLEGGTGLRPAVEQAIWARARDRETRIALANEEDISRQAEALGYSLPPGVLTAQLRTAHQTYYDKLSSLSRDISIKQAELEQQNLKDAIAAGMQMESMLVDYSYKLEQMTFEAARAHADNALQLHNAGIERLRALLAGYETYANVYKSIIEGELAKVEIYKAQLDAENTKAVINKSLVDAYRAQIDASMSQVEIYRAQVAAAQTLVQLEEAKIGAAGEQIRAYVAQVNAETAKIEAYKAQVGANAANVDIFRTKAQVFTARVEAAAEQARVHISRFSALYQAKASEWEGYRAQVQAEGERVRALAAQSDAQLDGYRAASAASIAQSEMHTKVWETQIKQYEAGQNIALQTAKINTDSLLTSNNARLDAAKVGAQVFAQLTSSAYGMMNASAGISGSSSDSSSINVSYSYSNDTQSTAPTRTTPW